MKTSFPPDQESALLRMIETISKHNARNNLKRIFQ
jgi:hypothetical protein